MSFLSLALHNLLYRRARTSLTLLGIATAIGAVVALTNIANGLTQSYEEIFTKRGVDLMVLRAQASDSITSHLPMAVGDRLRDIPGVQQVVPGLLEMISFTNPQLIAVPLQGYQIGSPALADLKVIDGRMLRPDDGDVLLVGSVLARSLGKAIGDEVTIDPYSFTIVGIFESFNTLENGSAVLVLERLQKLMDREGQVSGFQVIVEGTGNKEAEVARVRAAIEGLTGAGGRPLRLSAVPIRDHAANTLQIRVARAVAWLTSAIALLIGSIGMLNTMLMSVFERTRELGVMRAVGWTRSMVVRLVLLESTVLTLAGAALGTLGAVLVLFLLTKFPAVAGYITVHLTPGGLLQAFLIAVLIGLVGGSYPAVRAGRLAPMTAIRHE